MIRKRWLVLGVLGLAFVVCALALSVLSLPTAPSRLNTLSQGVAAGPAGSSSGGPPPHGGTCAATDVRVPDSPIYGWPMKLYAQAQPQKIFLYKDHFAQVWAGDWRTISSWFCDPEYFRGYTHWGIDLATRVSMASKTDLLYESIDDAEVIYTGNFGYVQEALADGGWNYGMGNHVLVRDLLCAEKCGAVPDKATLTDGRHAYALEDQCTSTVVTQLETGEVVTNTVTVPHYLDCAEDGWKVSYFHLRSVAVQTADLVVRSDTLGRIDTTGNSTGTHLHYQINSPDGAIDPAPSMCSDYAPGLRTTNRAHRPACAP